MPRIAARELCEMVTKPFILLHEHNFGSAFVRPPRRIFPIYAFLVHPGLARNYDSVGYETEFCNHLCA